MENNIKLYLGISMIVVNMAGLLVQLIINKWASK